MKISKNIRLDIMKNKIENPKYYSIYQYNFNNKKFEKLYSCLELSLIIRKLEIHSKYFPDDKIIYRLYPRKNKIIYM